MTVETGGTEAELRANLLAGLEAIARWHVGLGNALGSPFGQITAEGAPAAIQDQLAELRSLTYADLLRLRESSGDHPTGIAAHMERLSKRERTLLLERVLPDRPTTLQTLGQRWGVSHQRVAQLERDFRTRIGTLIGPNAPAGQLLAQLREAGAPLTPLSTLIELFPRLADMVPGTDIPVWRLIDRVTDDLEIRDGWFAVPSLESGIRSSRQIARELEIVPGVSFSLSRESLWNVSPELIADWARHCGYVALQNYWVAPAGNVADTLEQLLVVTAKPQTADDLGTLLRTLGSPRSPATVAAALRDDPRFRRTAPDTWDLAQRHASFADGLIAIRNTLDERGPTPLRDILARSDELGLPAESFEYQATHGLFTVAHGRVTYRTAAQPTSFPAAEAPQLVRLDGGWGYLTTLTATALERSLLQISSSIPPLFGMDYPGTRDLPALPGARILWHNAAAFITLPEAVLRRFHVGDRLFVWFGFGSVEFRLAEPVNPTLTGYPAALNSLGLPASGDPGEDASALVAALDLSPDTELPAILDALRRKREWTALAALAPLAHRPDAAAS